MTEAEMNTLVEKIWNRVMSFDDKINLDSSGNPTPRSAQMETFLGQLFARVYRIQTILNDPTPFARAVVSELNSSGTPGDGSGLTEAQVENVFRRVLGSLAPTP